MSDTVYEGYEAVEPDGYLQPKRYRASYECPNCGHRWKSRISNSIPVDNPPCPSVKCAVSRETTALAQQVANLTRMLQEQRAPAQVGAKPQVRAVDATAEIVMQDNQLTNLRDNIRQGETMAPPLPVPMQRAADNFFRRGQPEQRVLGTSRTLNVRQQNRLKAMGARAIAGDYRNAAVAPTHVFPRAAPPVRTLMSWDGK